MITSVVVVLAAAVAAFVLTPLCRPHAAFEEEGEEADALLEETAAETLRDIELDHDTGKLSAEDYRDLRARCEAQAATRVAPPQGRGSA